MPVIQALVVDYGGVLTNSLAETMGAWFAAEGVDGVAFGHAMGALLGPQAEHEAAVNPVHALERGEIEIPHFEERLAEHLVSTTGDPVRAEGLLTRMFAGFERAEDMIGVVRRVRQAGFKTALLSNSWGLGYPREDWEELFDVTVISGEVGLRKPNPRSTSCARGSWVSRPPPASSSTTSRPTSRAPPPWAWSGSCTGPTTRPSPSWRRCWRSR